MCRPVERIDLTHVDEFVEVVNQGSYSRVSDTWLGFQWTFPIPRIVVSGGPEPMHPGHVRDLRDQAEAAGVPFVFMGWGEWVPEDIHLPEYDWTMVNVDPMDFARRYQESVDYYAVRVGSENSGCTLDGKAYPWESEVKA